MGAPPGRTGGAALAQPAWGRHAALLRGRRAPGSALMGAMDFELDRFINQLGRGTVDPLTELVCRISFLVALWMLLGLAALRLDKKAGPRVFACVLLAMA